MRAWFRRKFRKYLSDLLGLDWIENRVAKALHESNEAKVNVKDLKAFLNRIRSTTFAGSTNDGIKNELIIINHDTVTNEWKVVYDNGLRSNTYMGLLKELRELIKRYDARYVAVNAGDNMLDIKARMGLDTKEVPLNPKSD